MKNNSDKLFKNRVINVAREILVNNNTLEIFLWDNNSEDGDIISLYLNDVLILENFEVKKKKKKISINLDSENSILTLHAINLGKHPPNTAAISIFDGEKNMK